MGVFWGTWAALLPEMRVQVGANDAQLGLALLGAGIGALPAMVLTGRLWARLGWWLMPVTAAAFAVAALTPLLVNTPLALAAALVAIGASSGSMDVSMNSAVSDIEVATRRRLMYGAHALFSLAVLIGSISTTIRSSGLCRSGTSYRSRGPGRGGDRFDAVARRRPAAARVEPGIAGVMPTFAGLITALAVLCAVAFLIEDALQNWSALLMERELGASPAIGGAAGNLRRRHVRWPQRWPAAGRQVQ